MGNVEVSVYTLTHTYHACTRLPEFEDLNIESLWLLVSPFRLPRSISIILVAVVYHPPNHDAEENGRRIEHISNNIEALLTKHPDGQVDVNGDFNPTSTDTNNQTEGGTFSDCDCINQGH